ncbi:putative IcmB-like type IV secretion system protein [Pseudomonas luteola]|uniref:Putative IcmB-like type IV secretion system protein n=1 Tax=Pseudomonas luteola TaxID=47886 RepID=A0A2X2BYA5_PSELU|nr:MULTISPECIES: hypothetical protein [Pseudomonas]MBA1250174.1 hypothetical protein [Pseudomonas zeshuii]MBH3440925.1 hypothetical protein [Pseudomonas luteola]SPY99973.1 putative IcmB-like type IV secretion system protein [Pseudomonas luteola]
MSIKFADRVMDSLDELRRGIRGWTKGDHTQYFPIACKHNEYVLALHNGSLMSVLDIRGYMGQYFPSQYQKLTKKWSQFMQTISRDKSAKGFDLFWSYEFDPEGMNDAAHHFRQRMVKASERRGLDIKDILEEEADLYGEVCAMESQYLMIVTHIESLPKADQIHALKRAAHERKSAAKGVDCIVPQAGIKGLEAVHEQHVNKVKVFLKETMMGYMFERLNCYEALWAMRHSFAGGTTGPGWKARLTMNDCRFRSTDEVPVSKKVTQASNKPNDWSFIMPPQLSEQMVPEGVVDLGPYVVVGERTYAPMYVSELAVAPQPLEELLRMCYQRRLPIRMVYSLMSNSEQANYWNRLFAGVFNFASASNRQIAKADRAMKAYQESNGAVLGYGISITTWAPTQVVYDDKGQAFYDVKALQKKAQDIETLVQHWGNQQVDTIFGCSVEALMSATPGYAMPPACPKAPQIELDIIAQLPIMRSSRIWEPEAAIWFRTAEGVLNPYQPFTSKQNAMLSMVLGGMGYGKSNLLSEHIFNFAYNPDIEEMPYIRGIDFGASAAGVVDMIRDSLPDGRKHEAVFQGFSNNGKMVKNMLDTRLGLRLPLSDHLRFLQSWLLILCESLIKDGDVSNVVAVLTATIQRAYERRNPESHLFEPVFYHEPTANPFVVKMVKRAELPLDDATHYWEIVDGLISFGLKHNDNDALHAAKLAQRNAVPKFEDLIKSCNMLEDQFKKMPQIAGTSMVSAVTNALMNANALFPCFTGITNTDISESRVCIFDMSEAFGRGSTPHDDWLRSVYFATVYRLLTEDLFINKIVSGNELADNQDKFGLSDDLLAWHIAYFERQDQIIKAFLADELHRCGKVEGALELIDSMGFEGRKYRVGMILGTQMPQHLPPSMIKLASSVFIFGASQSAENAKVLQQIFDLSDDERQILEGITKPNPEKGAEVFVIHKTEMGVQHLKLHFQMGNIKRWAYANEPEERGLRGILYAEGPSTAWARRVLAKNISDVKKAIKAKQANHDGQLSTNEAVRLIANDLLQFAS